MSTVVAVALGLTPLPQAGAQQIVSGDYSRQVGRFHQHVNHRGTIYVRGHDRRGIAYELVMDKRGYVEASVGNKIVTFRVQEAA